jgi:hypothetical protein
VQRADVQQIRFGFLEKIQRSVTKLRAIKIPTFQVCEEQCTIFL